MNLSMDRPHNGTTAEILDLDPDQTLALIGCGNLGTSILERFLSYPPKNISRIHATVCRPRSVASLSRRFHPHKQRFRSSSGSLLVSGDTNGGRSKLALTVSQDNISAIQQSSVVLLSLRASLVASVLGIDDVRSALAGKLVISFVGGMDAEKMNEVIYGSPSGPGNSGGHFLTNGTLGEVQRCRIIRALPNICSSIGLSTTIVSLPSGFSSLPACLSSELSATITQTEELLRPLGQVITVPANLMSIAGSLAACSPALVTVMIDGLLNGALAEGLDRGQGLRIMLGVLNGVIRLLGEVSPSSLNNASDDGKGALMVTNKEEKHGQDLADEIEWAEMEHQDIASAMHTAILREKISSPQGSTIKGILILEEEGVKSAYSKAIRECVSR